MKAIDFFCGAGGMGLGLIQAGFQIVAAYDFDKYTVQSYRHNVGDHVQQADISKMTATDLQLADLWAFGFPCQDLSVAGNRAGLFEGQRSGLFFEVMRLLDETERQPSILLAENVKGLRPYLPVLEEEYAKRGYRMFAQLLNSKYWGVPQSRERYFVVGVKGDKPFLFPEQNTQNIPKLSSVLETNVPEKYYVSEEKARGIIEEALKKIQVSGVHACLTPDREKRQNGPRAKEEEAPMFTLNCQDRHGVIEPTTRMIAQMYPGSHAGRVWDTEGLSPTVKTPSGGNTQPLIVTLPPYRVRKLTPREFARLQGFPDTYEQIVSDSQFYKQMGNAVTVNVARAMGQAILHYMQGASR